MADEAIAQPSAEATTPVTEEPKVETPPLVEEEKPSPAPEAPEVEKAEAEKPESPKSEVPEDYGDFVDAEGKVAFPASEMPEFVAAAKELGLSKEKAQKLFGAMIPTMRTKLQSSTKAIQGQWKAALLSDPEVGGERFKENMVVTNTAYRKYVTPELDGIMRSTGLSMHPDFVKMFFRIGKSLSQDTGVSGTGTPEPKRKLFPNSNME